MRCLDENRVTEFLDGRLAGAEREGVEAHVDGCDDCRLLLAQLVRTFQPAATPEGTPSTDGSADRRAFAAPPVIGDRKGRYVVVDWLGSGGMGIVYAAYDPELDRKVALKVLQPEASGESASDVRARLLREAKALARVSHPNVLNVFDVDADGDWVFVAMELVDGGTLGDWLAEESRSWRQVLDVLVPAGRGLGAAHSANLVHRDFKPANVLVGTDGRVRVADFGLARASETGTEVGAAAGTPAYMAPEQFRGAATAKSDQFAYCVVLYEALYGEHPFDHPERPERGPVRAAPRGSRVPAWLRAAVVRGLRENPDERHESMDSLLRELGRDTLASRRRWAAAAAIVVAAVVIGALVSRSGRARTDVCTGSETKLAGVWDDGRKQAMAGAFDATGRPFARDAWNAAQRTIDEYTRRWVTTRTAACEATQRGEQSADLLDLRMACLDERLDEVRALGDVFTRADTDVVTNAPSAAQQLGRLSRCSDVQALRSRVKPPADPAVAARVDVLRRRIAEVKALDDAGHYMEAVPLAAQAAETASTVGYRPLEAEALFRWGDVQVRAGDAAAGEATLRRAAWVADGAARTGCA